MAGVAGFEPTNARVKVSCLTAWRHPNIMLKRQFGALGGIRTPDLCLRRALLYPTELRMRIGAGEGNRTLATSLEGWSSTIELHPQITF